jgi:hypothetical protein
MLLDFDVLPASHACKHPLVGSPLPDGFYELVPDSASGYQEEQSPLQQPPPAAEVPAHQDLSSAPAPEYQQGKHRYMSRNFKSTRTYC